MLKIRSQVVDGGNQQATREQHADGEGQPGHSVTRVSEVRPAGYRDCTASAAVSARKPISGLNLPVRTIGLDAPDDFGYTFELPITHMTRVSRQE